MDGKSNKYGKIGTGGNKGNKEEKPGHDALLIPRFSLLPPVQLLSLGSAAMLA
jgi:hypothetical protein